MNSKLKITVTRKTDKQIKLKNDLKARFPLASKNPSDVVGHYMRHFCEPICYYAGEFYLWNGRVYTKLDPNRISSDLYKIYDKYPVKLTENLPIMPYNAVPQTVGILEKTLALKVLVDATDNPKIPFFIDRIGDDIRPEDMIIFENGMLHMPTSRFYEHTSCLFAVNGLPCVFDENAGPPTQWLNFLNGILPGDQSSINLIQEWFGYILTSKTNLQKFLFVLGPPRSGKGTIGRIAEAMIGTSNIAAPKLRQLGTPFGQQQLINKSVAIIGDCRLSPKEDKVPILESLLGIIGEDTFSVERKNLPNWTGKLPTRFMVASNDPLHVLDTSGALESRMLIVRLDKSHTGQEDYTLYDRIVQELPQIVRWSLDGLQRLEDNGNRFTETDTGDIRNIIKNGGSAVAAFVESCCEKGDQRNFRTPKSDMLIAYRKWAQIEERHISDKFNVGSLTSDLLSVGGIRELRNSKEYAGIILNAAGRDFLAAGNFQA